MSLETELARRAARGYRPVTMAELDRQLHDLGYARHRSIGFCAYTARIVVGEGEGDTYPAKSIYIVEADTRMSAFHFQARRDEKFRRLQETRGEGSLFAVVRGYIVDI
jgi:hypothetical protein